jgi:hypothetical protein
MKPIKRSYLVEINVGTTVPGNGSNINFQDYPQLRNVFFAGAIVCDSNTVQTSPSGKTVLSDTAGITLTLVDKFNQEVTHQYPTKDLNPYYVSGLYRDFVPFPIQMTKSYITILNNGAINANESILINIFYYTEKEFAALTARK